MDGTYEVTLDTPIGIQRGRLILKTDGDALSGTLIAMNNNAEINGKATDNGFTFNCTVNYNYENIPVDVEGTVEEESIKGRGKTRYGVVLIRGNKVV